jgi:hypothetical protein
MPQSNVDLSLNLEPKFVRRLAYGLPALYVMKVALHQYFVLVYAPYFTRRFR